MMKLGTLEEHVTTDQFVVTELADGSLVLEASNGVRIYVERPDSDGLVVWGAALRAMTVTGDDEVKFGFENL